MDEFSGSTIYEHSVMGEYARIAAIDVDTGLEVVVFGPASAARHDLERLAYKKLQRALTGGGPRKAPRPLAAGRRGKVV